MSLSAIFKGNSMLFGAAGMAMAAGMGTGLLFIYSQQHEPTDIEYWNKQWNTYRSKYPSITTPPWKYKRTDESILRQNNYEYLKLLTPKLPKLTNPAQIKSIRMFVPLCGDSEDLEIINDFVMDKIKSESISEEQSKQYKLKIIGTDASKDAIEMFLDKLDMKEKEIDAINDSNFNYNEEYNFPSNEGLYQIDDDVFSKINIYKHKSYNLINCDIFDASTQRLVLRADAIYDNESFSIINPKRRKQYIRLMENVIKQKGKILLVTERYDIEERDIVQRDKSPFPINSKDELFNLYKRLVSMEPNNIKLLQSTKWSDDSEYGKQKLKQLGFSQDYQNAYTDVWLIECQKNI